MTLVERFDRLFEQRGSMRGLAVLRIALGPVVVVHLSIFAHGLLQGRTYRDTFWEPWVSWWQPPVAIEYLLVFGGMLAAVGMALGWRTRWTATVTLACVAGNFFLSQHDFRHNRAFLLYLLAGVALGGAGRALALDARRRRDDTDWLWPIWLLRFLAASVYFASGFSKLVDRDWVGGLVLWDRTVRFQHHVRDADLLGPLADPLADLVIQRWVHTLTSPIAVAIELFLAFGLWFARTRLAAIWVGVFFHLSIELSASVEIFSLAALAALSIWVTPSTRDRVAEVPAPYARLVQAADWYARFEVVASDRWRVVDRDGTVLDDWPARRLVLTRLPATFFVAALAPVRPRRGAWEEPARAH